MALKAVLFDMDGTLVDSIPAWHATFNHVLRLQGMSEITYERFCADILGQSIEKDIETFFPHLTVEGLKSSYKAHFPKYLGGVELFPETPKVLEYLEQKGLKKGIVTNTPRDLMFLTLDKVGLSGRFESALGGDDVTVGKPDPEIIVKSLKEMGVDRKDALMVGDTNADMNAGKRANVKTVGVGIQGDWMVGGIGELPRLLEQIGK